MYLLVVAGALLLLGQFILPATAGPYLEEGGESLFVYYLPIYMTYMWKNFSIILSYYFKIWEIFMLDVNL
jgi:hypothetical protein